MTSIYNIDVKTIDGKTVKLADYQGKTLLIVNVASACGLTPQYEGLEALYEAKKDQGLEVLGFPCNQFGGQEPGTEAEIKDFCTLQYNVEFPLFAKIDVNGDNRHPLYKVLMKAMPARIKAPDSDFEDRLKSYGIAIQEGNIAWNFEKFLVSSSGQVVGHFAPDITPENPLLSAAIERELNH